MRYVGIYYILCESVGVWVYYPYIGIEVCRYILYIMCRYVLYTIYHVYIICMYGIYYNYIFRPRTLKASHCNLPRAQNRPKHHVPGILVPRQRQK